LCRRITHSTAAWATCAASLPSEMGSSGVTMAILYTFLPLLGPLGGFFPLNDTFNLEFFALCIDVLERHGVIVALSLYDEQVFVNRDALTYPVAVFVDDETGKQQAGFLAVDSEGYTCHGYHNDEDINRERILKSDAL